jgi:hypothetical protein
MMSKRYRRGAGFVDTRRCFRPIDRNSKARLLYIAEAIEHRTKGAGCRQGALGHIGIKVLRALLLTFLDGRSGRCEPAYDAIAEKANVCRQSVANALARLEACGLLTITRRIVREVIDGIWTSRQASNCYAFGEPGAAPCPPCRTGKVRSFPSPMPALLALLNALAPKPSLLSRGDSAKDLKKGLSGAYAAGGGAS